MMASNFSGLTIVDMKRMAFELAISWYCPFIFNITRKHRLEVAAYHHHHPQTLRNVKSTVS
jgi:hypothetical protein